MAGDQRLHVFFGVNGIILSRDQCRAENKRPQTALPDSAGIVENIGIDRGKIPSSCLAILLYYTAIYEL